MNLKTGRRRYLPLLINLCLAAFLSITQAQAQSTVTFAYDSDGNRIARTILLTSETSSGNSFFEESIAGSSVKIYPGYSEQKLTIEIPEFSQERMVTLYNNEESVADYTFSETSTVVDLSTYENGEYTLLITVDGRTSSWQIIKQV